MKRLAYNKKRMTLKELSVCRACSLERATKDYDMGTAGNAHMMGLCVSCANVVGLSELLRTTEGKMLLTINSKLDILLRKK